MKTSERKFIKLHILADDLLDILRQSGRLPPGLTTPSLRLLNVSTIDMGMIHVLFEGDDLPEELTYKGYYQSVALLPKT